MKKYLSILLCLFYLRFILIAPIASAYTSEDCDVVLTTKTEAAIEAAFAGKSGPYRVCLDGSTWTDIGEIDIEESGSSGKMLILSSENPGGATLAGNTYIHITGAYVQVEGIKFVNILSNYNYRFILHFDSGASNGKAVDNYFDTVGSGTYRNQAIVVDDDADDVEIYNNELTKIYGMGIWTAYSGNDAPLRTHIHHNYLHDWPLKATTPAQDDCNPIYIGGDETYHDFDTLILIEKNLLINASSDTEGLGGKNSSVTVRYNVFKNFGEAAGCGVDECFSYTITVRMGEDWTIFNNWSFLTDSSLMGGVRLYDAGHLISNNYFGGLTGGYGIVFSGERGGTWPTDEASNSIVDANTFAYGSNSLAAFVFTAPASGPPYPNGELAAHGITFKNTILHQNNGVRVGYDLTSGNCSATYTKNLAYTSGSFFSGTGCGGSWPSDGDNINQMTAGEFSDLWTTRSTDYGTMYVLDCDVSPGDCSENIAIEYGSVSYGYDIDGQARDGATPDVGADEYSVASIELEPIPLTCVGPTWADGYVDCEAAEEQSTPTATGVTFSMVTP